MNSVVSAPEITLTDCLPIRLQFAWHQVTVGDCAATMHPRYGRIRLGSWRYAQDQGGVAARAMLGESVRFDNIPWFWSDQYEIGLQSAGIFNAENTSLTRIVSDQTQFLFELSQRITSRWLPRV